MMNMFKNIVPKPFLILEEERKKYMVEMKECVMIKIVRLMRKKGFF